MEQTDDFDAPEALLTPSEVAALFRVNPKTVTRWARAGKLTAIRTLGGHRRFRAQVTPGDTLELETRMDKLGSTAGRGSGTATVNGKLACEASMLFVVVRA